ncbi:MAG: SHOCT domain-containing protein [Solirubrobacteraceae bacterium]
MSASFAVIAQAFDGHMGGGWSWLVIVALVVTMGAVGWMLRGAGSDGRGSSEDPVDVLKTRYARGELTTEEFQERVRTIEDARR